MNRAHGSSGWQGERTLREWLAALRRRWAWLLLLPSLAAILAYVGSEKLISPVYTSFARILPPQYNATTASTLTMQPGATTALANAALAAKNPADIYIGILRSRTIADVLINRFGLAEKFRLQSIDDVRVRLEKMTRIAATKNGILQIEVAHTDANLSSELTNAYIAALYEVGRELSAKDALRRQAFYDRSLQQAQMRLQSAEKLLKDTELRTGLTRLDGQQAAIAQSASDLRAQIAAKEMQLNAMRGFATARNPDVRVVAAELGTLKKQLRVVESSLQSEHTDANGLMVPVRQIPQAMLDHTRARREVRNMENLVEWLGRLKEFGQIDESRDLSLVQVLDYATVPDRQTSPRPRMNAIAAGLGMLMLSVIWVLLTSSAGASPAIADSSSSPSVGEPQ